MRPGRLENFENPLPVKSKMADTDSECAKVAYVSFRPNALTRMSTAIVSKWNKMM